MSATPNEVAVRSVKKQKRITYHVVSAINVTWIWLGGYYTPAIGATLAGVEAARALEVEVGAPLLRLTRVVFDVAGRPVERVVALYRADAYQYHMQLRPSPARA